jgi:serpin B
VIQCNFAATPERERLRINAWVAEQTRQRIQDLLAPDQITDSTRIVLTNAIWLKASWRVAFEQSSTRHRPFTRLDGSVVTVPTMAQTEHLRYHRGEHHAYVELPYANSHLAMGLLVPDAGQYAAVEQALTAASLQATIAASTIENISLSLPRFRSTSKLLLKEALIAMGMPTAFAAGRADFSGIDDTKLLFIGQVVHQTFINVDERGTEAAAATAVVVMDTGRPAEPTELAIDRPFLYVIRDLRNGSILFIGRVMDPSANE